VLDGSLTAIDGLISRSRWASEAIDAIAARLLPTRPATALACGYDGFACYSACIDCNCRGCGPCFGFNCKSEVYSPTSVNCANGYYTARQCTGCCF
jgi:hypothetical protein